jgi:xanthine dehydrogenase molybdenum-binding subunit
VSKHPEDQQARMVEMFDNLGADKYPLQEFKYIGQKIPRRMDGIAKATGQADFTMDIQLPGMLHMRFLMSPYPHARIVKMDTGRAERLPGVRYILRYDDPELPETENLGFFTVFQNDKPLDNVAHFEGQLMGAAVAADTEDIAEEALSLIDIEWEQRPFNLDPVAASEPGALLSYPERYADGNFWNRGVLDEEIHGDVKKGFAGSDRVIEFKITRKGHTWAGPERFCGVWKWNGDCAEVWLKNQRGYVAKKYINTWFGGIPMNKIELHMVYQGATFGGFTHTDWNLGGLYCAAVVSKRTKRPVKYAFTRREDFYGSSMDEGVYFVKAGFNNDGAIQAVDATVYHVNAIHPVYGPVLHLLENTRIPHLHGQIKSIWVNRGPGVAIRCEMIVPVLVQTMLMDRVAAELGMDPTEVALKNDGCLGHDMNWLNGKKKERGFEVHDSLRECIEKGKAEFKWDESWHKPGARKLPNGRMHGAGFNWAHEWSSSTGSGEIAIRIERNDGTATLLGMHCDNGVDAESTYCQIAADELGMRLEDVRYNPHFDPGFHLNSPDSSCGMAVNGWAVRHAARILKQRILESATSPCSATQRGSFPAAFPNMKPEDLDIRDSTIFVKADRSRYISLADFARPMAVQGPISNTEVFGARNAWTEPLFAHAYDTQEGEYNPNHPREKMCRQAYFMEVEVDTETGQVFTTRMVTVNDVGKVINRMSCEGQQYGGGIMGISRGKLEEIVIDPVTGVMLNGNLVDYKVATIKDVCPISTILVETGMGYGPYGVVGIGEDIATVVPPLIAPAVYNAIGVWIDEFPITPDRVLKALGKI